MSTKSIIRKEYFTENSHLRVPKSIIREIGLEAAVMLSNLVGAEEFYETKMRNALTKDGFFYQTVEDTFNNTGLNKRHSKNAIDTLVEQKYISYRVQGLPPRRYFRIEWLTIQTLFQTLKMKRREKALTDYEPGRH